jgi:hypothetical protein
MKTPKELFSQNKRKLSKFELIAFHIFECNKRIYSDFNEWKEFYNGLNEEAKEELGKFSHFYYFICKPYMNFRNDDISGNREELSIVGITSLMEVMMELEGYEYKTFFEWYESMDNKEKSITKDYEELKKGYSDRYGAAKKVRRYFDKYIIDEDDKRSLLDSIERYSERREKFVKFKDIKGIANVLYDIRSNFVHNAKMGYLCPPQARISFLIIGEKPYKVRMHLETLMKIFENSFIHYWEEKSKTN